MQEQGRGIHFHRSGQEPTEELNIPAKRTAGLDFPEVSSASAEKGTQGGWALGENQSTAHSQGFSAWCCAYRSEGFPPAHQAPSTRHQGTTGLSA